MSAGAEIPPPGQNARRPSGPSAASLLFTLLIATVALGVLVIVAGRGASQDVSYTAFRQHVRAGDVTGAVVGASRIRWTHRSGERFTTIRVDDPSLITDLDAHGVIVTGEVSTGPWTGLIWLLPFVVLLLVWVRLLRGAGMGGQGALAFGRSRARIYAESDVKVTFADVAGIDEATEELREIVDFLQHPAKYTEIGGRIPKGVLLVGPPGTGKTLLARAVAGEARVPFFSLSGSEFVEMFVGVGAARVRDLFAQAEGRAPCIVFIDELDAIGKMRTVSPLGTHEEREQTLNQLLAEMDGFDPRKGIIVMSATNRPEVLDPALLRPGRFDRRVVVDRPDVHGREAILSLHARKVKLAAEVDLRVVAARTTGFAGADLANLVNEATLLAARRGQRAVTMSDFEEALERVLAGLKRKRLMSAREREIVAVHEAGHAIVASRLPGVDPVHRISIVQRGYDALGHTLQVPVEDRHLKTHEELRNQLAVWLAGRAAEVLVFHEISTGGHNDLQQATEVARAMVAQFGMSEALGPVAFDVRRRQSFLPGGAEPVEPVAQETAREIDLEVKRLMTDADGRARQMIGENRPALDAIVRRLLEQEVVEGDEVRRLLTESDPAPPPHRAEPSPGESRPAAVTRARPAKRGQAGSVIS
jgi:cell division protease FtsH